MSYHVNEKGYYGQFGGAFIPEMLYPNVEELRQNYLKVMAEPDFKEEFDQLLERLCRSPNSFVFRKTIVCKIQYQNIPETGRFMPHGCA